MSKYRIKKIYVAVILFISVSISIKAQVVDSSSGIDILKQAPTSPKKKVKPLYFPTYYITEGEIDHNSNFHPIDTSMQREEINNPMYRKWGVFQDLGNVATPGQSLIFNGNRPMDFNLCLNPFETYFKRPEDTKYYNTKLPYSDFTYTQGYNELQQLYAKHSQNISPRWNFGVDYYGVTSKGYYLSQYTNTYHTQVFNRYQSKSGKYDMLLSMNFNYGVLDENGGIRSDSAFEYLTGASKTAEVRLQNSETRFKSNSVYLKQYFHFGKTDEIITKDDTTYTFHSRGYFSHTFKAENMSYIFNSVGDTNRHLLPDFLYDTIFTTVNGIKTFTRFDSLYYGQISNRLAYTLYNDTSKANERRYLELAISHKYISVSQHEKQNSFNNILLEGKIERQKFVNNSISFQAYGGYFATGYNQNDLRLSVDASYRTALFDLSGGVYNHLFRPDFTSNQFRSYSFIWDNDFLKTNISNWHVAMHTRKFKNNFHFSFNQYLLANWVYYDKSMMPKQSSDVILMQQLEAQKLFKVWRFYFDNRIVYQKTNNDFIRLPELSAILRYYFETPMFKNRVTLQLGTDIFYNTAYYGNAYNPATRSFYIQDEVKIGNYPMINAFASIRLRKAVIYFVYEHINQDWVNKGFYYTVNSPLPLAGLRTGVRWRIFD